MTAPLRLGGRLRTIDGRALVWSVAEGVRGRRWRESVIATDGHLGRALLLEVSPTTRPTRLEIATATGLLTLHPEADEGTLHGNVVTSSGVRHLTFEWSVDHELLVLGSPASAATSLARLGASMAIGDARSVPMLRIDDALEPRPVSWTVERRSASEWVLRADLGDEVRRVSLRDDGLVDLPDLELWPLEIA